MTSKDESIDIEVMNALFIMAIGIVFILIFFGALDYVKTKQLQAECKEQFGNEYVLSKEYTCIGDNGEIKGLQR